MKKFVVLVCFIVMGSAFAQNEIKPLYEKEGDLIKVTHFHNNGNVKEQGFYKDKLLHGKWVIYDAKGDKKVMAFYEKGKKVGKWFIWDKDELKEINYENNSIASIQSWKESTKIAVK
ncbi:toxin-antitoxin system YwqK family antitoxin [Tenacibaculum sp. ZS6-P6]|uniref:toxin-antitoxin system YwqK family antitoxin n=1 Tax=Tenacibaculum sp. ZS6-P6 TaxID=3447503 RepID=UPI003F9E575C